MGQRDRAQATQVVGLRQTGKTTLMEEIRRQFPDSIHYPLQDLVTLRRYGAAPERWVLEIEQHLLRRRDKGRLHVFVDEVQKILAFFQAIQGLYDSHKGRIKFWIWGSSARPVKRLKAETLAGRVLSKRLWPLSQSELLERESIVPLLIDPKSLVAAIVPERPRGYLESLKGWLERSLLPEPNLMENPSHASELLEAYQATYLENEIRRENLVKDIGVFENFLALSASEDGSMANHSAQGKTLGISAQSVKGWYEILEDTFVADRLNAVGKSLRVQIAKSPKVYFTDTGLARFVGGARGEVLEKTSPFGRLFEGFVINEIRKQCDYHSLPWRLSFLRTKTNQEVDLIVKTPHGTFAIEIKSSERVSSSDLKTLWTAMDLDPEIRYGLVVSLQSAPVKLAPNIWNLPVWML